jgi:prophage regulatory protein
VNARHEHGPGETEVRLIPLAKVRELTSLGTSALYQRMADGTFPRAVLRGSRNVAWRLDQVQAWINSRPLAPLKSAGATAEHNGQKVAA